MTISMKNSPRLNYPPGQMYRKAHTPNNLPLVKLSNKGLVALSRGTSSPRNLNFDSHSMKRSVKNFSQFPQPGSNQPFMDNRYGTQKKFPNVVALPQDELTRNFDFKMSRKLSSVNPKMVVPLMTKKRSQSSDKIMQLDNREVGTINSMGRSSIHRKISA
jgi:hypothetical protein